MFLVEQISHFFFGFVLFWGVGVLPENLYSNLDLDLFDQPYHIYKENVPEVWCFAKVDRKVWRFFNRTCKINMFCHEIYFCLHVGLLQTTNKKTQQVGTWKENVSAITQQSSIDGTY